MASIHPVSDKDDFDKQLKKAGTNLVVVEFYIVGNVAHSRIASRLHNMAKCYTNVSFLQVDADLCEDTSGDYRINYIPTFIFIKEGVTIAEFYGDNLEKLQELIDHNNK